MISEIRLQHFRSYTDAIFRFSPEVTVVVGANASGKTNLLESLLVVAKGSSYRVKDNDLIQFDNAWARVDAKTNQGIRTLKLTRDPQKKLFEIESHPYLRLPSTKYLPVVLFEPNHMLLFSGSPELRRSFLDDMLEQTSVQFGQFRRHYKRVLAQRNALLKNNPRNQQELFVWNVRLSELGGKIVRERNKLVNNFNQLVTFLYNEISGEQSNIHLIYNSQFVVEQYETSLLEKLEQSTELDILRGFTAHGPHRDDLAAEINNKAFAESASRGENRTLVLVLKLLELEYIQQASDKKAILLLDDVFSELDASRRAALIKCIKNQQTIITTTDADIALAELKADQTIFVSKP